MNHRSSISRLTQEALIASCFAAISISATAQASSAPGWLERMKIHEQNDMDSPAFLHVNHCFNLGNQDGLGDRHKTAARASHKSSCDATELDDSYRTGYDMGFIGERSYRRDHRLSAWARSRVSY